MSKYSIYLFMSKYSMCLFMSKYSIYLFLYLNVSARVIRKSYGEKGIKYLHVFGIKVLPTPSPSLAPKRARKVNTVAVIFNSL